MNLNVAVWLLPTWQAQLRLGPANRFDLLSSKLTMEARMTIDESLKTLLMRDQWEHFAHSECEQVARDLDRLFLLKSNRKAGARKQRLCFPSRLKPSWIR